jgi:hypothetical protein
MQMQHFTKLAAVATVVFGLAAVSYAQTTFIVPLTNAAEPGGVTLTMSGGGSRPASFGTATLVLAADNSNMTMVAEITNIDVTGTQTPNDTNDNLAAAHIHASATVTPTTNAGVVWGFFGSPDNDTTPSDLVVTPFASPGVGGTFTSVWNAVEGNSTTLAAQVSNLLAGRAYLNFHTTQNGGGEIRGMLPEPTGAAVLLLGAFAGMARRRSSR